MTDDAGTVTSSNCGSVDAGGSDRAGSGAGSIAVTGGVSRGCSTWEDAVGADDARGPAGAVDVRGSAGAVRAGRSSRRVTRGGRRRSILVVAAGVSPTGEGATAARRSTATFGAGVTGATTASVSETACCGEG